MQSATDTHPIHGADVRHGKDGAETEGEKDARPDGAVSRRGVLAREDSVRRKGTQ